MKLSPLRVFISIIVLLIILAVAFLGVKWLLQKAQIKLPGIDTTKPPTVQTLATDVPMQTQGTLPQPGVVTQISPELDTRPVLTLGTDSFGSYFVAMQIAQDPTTPFRLEIVPFGFNEEIGNPSEADRGVNLANGKYDLLLTTQASFARVGNVGKIIFQVDQSDGADQIIVKNISSSGNPITSFNDFRGKSVCVADGNVDHFFVLAALRVVGIKPTEVNWVKSASVPEAVDDFIAGRCDIVSAWTPESDRAASEGNGTLFIDSTKWHNIIDVAVASDQAISQKRDLLKSFTYFWMKYAKSQADDLSMAGESIAVWTYNGQPTNDWTYVYPGTGKDDMILWLSTISQAGMAENIVAAQNVGYLKLQISAARDTWASADMIVDVKPFDLEKSIDVSFVQELANDSSLINSNSFVNGNFQPVPEILPPADANALLKATTIATLPCEKFDFKPNSNQLSEQGKADVQACAAAARDMILSSQGQILITGSAAWPTGYNESEVTFTASARATEIVQVFVKMGVPANRIAVYVSLPPVQDRGSSDENVLKIYRYAKIEIKILGR